MTFLTSAMCARFEKELLAEVARLRGTDSFWGRKPRLDGRVKRVVDSS